MAVGRLSCRAGIRRGTWGLAESSGLVLADHGGGEGLDALPGGDDALGPGRADRHLEDAAPARPDEP